MQQDYISFRDTGYFSKLMCDYLDMKPEVASFYNRYPNIENFKSQIEEKKEAFTTASRQTLVKALQNQYKHIKASSLTLNNIELIRNTSTFTVTTGHQLNLFTGPLYFLHKIIATINLAKALKNEYPDCNFVPIYWMATEDHDFEEINYFNFKGKKVQWHREDGGAVGTFNTVGLEAVFNAFASQLGQTQNAKELKRLFKSAYLKHDNLADATRYLANELFKNYGLVILDADDKDLKQQFMPYVKEELLANTAYKTVTETNKALSKNYSIQVNPREINLFYLSKGVRERIIYNNDLYSVNNTNITWTKEQLLEHVALKPECFSPNVIMRPLYQEVILPNLCYIGGGGEIAYWFQLKAYFKSVKVPFPMLLLRNSVLIQTKKQKDKLNNLNISLKAIFLKRHVFINKKIREISNINIDFTEQKKQLEAQFQELYTIAQQTDKSFLGAVKAQEKKQIDGLNYLEKRLLKAQKLKLADQVSRMTTLQNELFPGQSLQERNTNFSELYLEYGATLIPSLVEALNPLKNEFLVLTI